jgi:hypothetical protein
MVSMDARESVREALRLLVDQVEGRVDRHPAGPMISGERESLQLRLDLPLSASDEDLDRIAGELWERIDAGVREILVHRASFRIGRVFCLRCGSADCEHAAPARSREVFAGYGPSGVPRFLDLGELLLSRQDPRVGELFEGAGGVVSCAMTEEELMREVLPSFREGVSSYRVHGQVVAGWYRVPDPHGRRRGMALTVQVVSAKPRRMRRRFGVNVLGVGPGEEPLDHLHDRLPSVPWAPAVRWGQSVLRNARNMPKRRVEGLVSGLARRLERQARAADRRTRHAADRHQEGTRPTRMAWSDLARAEPGSLLFDTRRQTLIVLGERGRAHVFSLEGKLVTSVRYPPATISRRLGSGLWRTATPEEEGRLRDRTGVSEAGSNP